MTSPEVIERPGSWTFVWSDPHEVSIRIDRVQRHASGTIGCELTASSSADPLAPGGHILHTRMNDVLGTRIRSDTVKALMERFDAPPWADYLVYALEMMVRRVRMGPPVKPLVDVPFDLEHQWRLAPLLHERQPTILFGYGGALKSTLATYMAVRVALGIDAEPGNVLILDWESTDSDWRERQSMVAAGLGVGEPPNVFYRRCEQPLAGEAEAIQNMIGEYGIDFYIIDSAAYAVGDEPERAGPVIDLFQTMRAFDRTALVVAHQNRDEKSRRPYGNVYFENAARSTIQIKKSSEQSERLSVGLFNQKVNKGRPFAPFSMTAVFHQFDETRFTEGDSIVFERGALAAIPDLAKEGTSTDKISAYLFEADGPQAPSAIADGAKLGNNTVYQALLRMKDRGEVEKLGGNYRLTSQEGRYEVEA
jgi:hypothetical protein